MADKVYEDPKGSDKSWFSITLEGQEIVTEISVEKQLAFELAGRANAAAADGMSANEILVAMATAYGEYHKLPEYERRRRTFRLIPGGRTD